MSDELVALLRYYSEEIDVRLRSDGLRPALSDAADRIESQARLIDLLVRDCGIREHPIQFCLVCMATPRKGGGIHLPIADWRPGDEGYDELLAAVRRVRE